MSDTQVQQGARQPIFRDRHESGRVLAGLLEHYAGDPDVLVLGADPGSGVGVGSRPQRSGDRYRYDYGEYRHEPHYGLEPIRRPHQRIRAPQAKPPQP